MVPARMPLAASIMANMVGRALAICGWLAWQVRRPFGGRRSGARRAAPYALAAVLAVLAALPIVVPMLDPQPQDITVQDIIDEAVTEPDGWVRLRGEVVPLPENPTERPGDYGLLVDAADPLLAIVVRTDEPPEADESTMVTGHVIPTIAQVGEVPFEATVFGTVPTVVIDWIVQLDPVAKAPRVTWWPLAIPPLLLAVVLVIGAPAGYPIFRRSTEIDVLSTPLGPDDRLPAAWGGRLGPHERDLADPGAALLVARPGPKGNVLAAEPLPDAQGSAPPPVTIGGGWTEARVGYVFTVSETVAALVVRAEGIDVTFLFARTGERDRVAGLVSVERD
jgi:hypothetical protein